MPEKQSDNIEGLIAQVDGKDDETGLTTYPGRLGKVDCVYYLRTGMCGYGDNCMFNHPTYNDNQQKGNHPERVGEPDCAYYLKTSTCKYESTCKYNHPRDRHGAGPVVLNAVGLPVREGQESCSHYVRTGSCKFGVACKFHHPEPKRVGPDPPVSGPSSYAPAGSEAHIRYGYAWTAWSCLSPQTYFPVILPSSGLARGWSPYIGNMSPVLSTNGLSSFDHVYPRPSFDLPVRPGEPECRYFMDNGTCKYGSDCKYHHPRENMVKPDASSFVALGLPLRPGQPICSYYSLYGICKYGPGCKYDHPLMVYPYNYINGLTSLPLVDPTFLSYGEMNSSASSPSKSFKNRSLTSEHIGNVKLETDESPGDHVGSSRSSSLDQSD